MTHLEGDRGPLIGQGSNGSVWKLKLREDGMTIAVKKVDLGKGTLDYTDMKKILRGVALAQNRIEPSTININANIKTKLPVFQDDSDE